MKTPKATKLKSGNWRVQIQIDGKRYSCTGTTKKEAQDMARQIFAGNEIEKRVPLTVGKAIDNYISEKSGTLSPSTVKGYKAIRKNYLQDLMNINISDLTQTDVQLAVGNDSIDGKSPKTIRNAHGLLAAVLEQYRPNFHLNTRLPQKEKYEARIFTEDEMKKVWAAAKGTTYELPILLASWLGLRMSEIRGLKYKDFHGRDDEGLSYGWLHIHTAIVAGPDGDVEKGTKTTAGDRQIKLPGVISNLIYYNNVGKSDEDYICPWADITIYKNFLKICEKAGVEPCRFHDLRHFAASEALALGVPDKYSMHRMGHKTDNMLKTVYQHILGQKVDEFARIIDNRMEELYNASGKCK